MPLYGLKGLGGPTFASQADLIAEATRAGNVEATKADIASVLEETARATAVELSKVDLGAGSDPLILLSSNSVPSTFSGWAFEISGGYGAAPYGSSPYGA